jgi:hypothetical protein
MSPILGANPLDYDAKYPQTADTSVNEDAKMLIMERNTGKEVMFQIEDGTQYYGKISYVPNSEHYCVVVDRNGTPWEWYVREEATRLIEDTMPKNNLWQDSQV